MKILIANRGEIALRIARTAQRLGHEVVGVTTDVDSASQHAINLNAITVPSYLDGAAIISAARESGCGAIHPGYGFLSENASFAKDVVEADLIWIGPNADVINSMGSKINARAIAESAGVPLIPGYSDSQAEDDLRGAADNIGYPVLIKASAGGGGRGIRIVESPDQFATALNEARTEAERAFGDGSVIVERYVQQPRHVEVQLIGDRHGRVEHLGTRECSVQRRYQKLFEE
ncbi:MAG: biotin carboxylase N-terminal domain-containing protein, partial [Ilumatobacteraceae bacterium]